MTKAELIAEVQGKSWYGGILGSILLAEEYVALQLKVYRAHVKILKGANVLSNAHIYFYVFEEGGAGEVAYYKDSSPDEQAGMVV